MPITRNQNLVFYMLITFCLIAILFIVIVTFQTQKQIILEPTGTDANSLPKFFKRVNFSEYPEALEIQPGKFSCDAKNLRKCLLNDPTTLIGCRELNVRCQNFNQDTKFKDDNGDETIIPKNADANEGYALVVHSIVENCNIWHGDPVLVTTTNVQDKTSATIGEQSYLLVCQCKNPGYIGNSTILGACDTPFICNGQVDDINQPIDKINCKCRNDQKQVRYDTLKLPVCKDKLVKDLNETSADWTTMINWRHDRLAPIDQYPRYVRDNLNVSKLYDPCRSAINNVEQELNAHRENLGDIKGSNTNTARYGCVYIDSGIPVNGIREKDFNEHSDNTFPNAGLASDSWEYFRFTNFVGGEESPTAIRALVPDIDPFKSVTVVAKRRTWPFVSIRASSYHKHMLSGVCEGIVGGQRCVIKNNYYFLETIEYNWRFSIPQSSFRPLPFGHSDESIWIPMEKLGIYEPDGLNMRRSTGIKNLRFYGLFYGLKNNDQINRSGAVRMKRESDFILHKNSISKG